MRKLYLAFIFAFIVALALASYVTFGDYTPNPPVPVIGDLDDFSKPTPKRTPDYNPILVNSELVTIIRIDSGVQITNNTDNFIGYEVFETEVINRIEWAPCDSFIGCPAIPPGDTVEVPLMSYPSGDTATIFWWEKTNIPDTDSFINGEVYSQEIGIH